MKKWIIDLNMKPKTVKLVEYKIESLWPWLGNNFLYMTPKAQTIKEKRYNGLHQNQKLLCLKGYTIKKGKKTICRMEWKYLCHIFDKDQVSRLCSDLVI